MIKSIRSKIFLSFSLIFILSLGTVSLLWYQQSTQATTKLVKNYTYELIKEANENFELTLKDIDYLSTVISLNQPNVIDVLANPSSGTSYEQLLLDRRLNDFIASLYGYKYYISSILIVGRNGKSYSQGTTLSAEEVRRQPWYHDLIHNRTNRIFLKTHSFIHAGQAAFFPSQNVISVARAIKYDNEVLGVVVIDFRYDIVQKTFSTKIPHQSTLFVIDQNGAFVYHPDNLRLNSSIQHTVFRKLLSQIRGGEGHFTTRINGADQFVVFYRSNYTQWTTIGIISKKGLMSDALKTTNQTLYISLFTLIIVLLAANIIAMTITVNIDRLRDAMKDVGRGKLNVNVVIRTGDEIEELSRGFNTMVNEINQLLNDVKRKERQKRLAELKAFQAQINPHFLSNTLNTVRWLANAQKADNISSLVTSLIQLLQVSMGEEDFISIRRELEYVKDYLNIQEYRYCNKFKIQYEIEPALLDCLIPKFILQPIVENSLIHGIEPLDGQGLIVVKGYIEGDQIKLIVTDNGVGIPPDKLATLLREEQNKDRMRFNSIGICNVAERIKMYFGGDYGLQIESVPGLFTTVTITMPFIKERGESFHA